MGVGEALGTCLAIAVGLLVVATTGFDRWHKPRTHRRWQQTARQVARTRADVLRDLAAAKAEREAQIQARFDERFEQIIAGYPHGIPHQRSKEDNQ